MKFKSLLVILGILISTQIYAQDLVGHWKLDETSGVTAAEAANGLDGTLMDIDESVAWVSGIDGNAIDFSAGESTGRIEVPDDSILNMDSTNSFTISMLVKTDYSGNDMLLMKGARGTDEAKGWEGKHYEVFLSSKDLRFRVQDGSVRSMANNNVSALIKPNSWAHMVCVRNRADSTLKTYVNGQFLGEMADNTHGNINTDGLPLIIGNNELSNWPFNGKMDDVQILNYAMSGEDIATMTEGYGDLTDPLVIAHWKLDETTGWRANDAIGIADGILMDLDPATAWIEGIDGNAVDFSTGESTARIQVKDNSILNMDSTNSFTISMLVNTDYSGNDMLLMKGARGTDEAKGWEGKHYEVFLSSKDLRFRVQDGSVRSMANNNVSALIKPNSWAHMVCVRNRADSTLKTYVNGQFLGEMADNTHGNINTDGLPLIIGNNENSNWPFNGKLDDVQILNYAMSGEDIATMTEGYGDLTDPLVIAHWKMDETTGWRANDAIGIADGILMDLDPATAWIEGIDGNAIDFGSGVATSRVQVKDNSILNMDSTNSFTISMLVNTDYSGNDMLIMKGARGTDPAKGWEGKHYEVFLSSKDLRFRVQDGSVRSMASNNVSALIKPNSWAHMVCVRNRADSTLKTYVNGQFLGEMADNTHGNINTDGLPLIIGNNENSNWPFNGKLDDVQILNYAMSGEDIAAMTASYGDLTDPLIAAHWKLDETTGWRANDAVRIADGILIDLDPAVAWVEGRDGNAIDFGEENTKGYILINEKNDIKVDSTKSFSYSLLLSYSATDKMIPLAKGSWGPGIYFLQMNGPTFWWTTKGSGGTFSRAEGDFSHLTSTDTWFHLVAQRDIATDMISVYVNGSLISSVEDIAVGTIEEEGSALTLGAWPADLSRAYKGKMDDVRMYNYALSAEEVAALAEEYGYVVSVDGKLGNQIPVTYSLEQNYPNPFNPTTTIQFGIPKASDVRVTIYNSIGQRVSELVNGQMNAGYHEVNFNASNISSGIYFYRISAGDFVEVKKMLLLK